MNLGFHVINALPPVADAYNAAMDTDIIDAGGGDSVRFLIQNGVAGGAAVSTVTVEACSNIVAGAVATVPFTYRSCVSGDTWGAWTAATASGFSAAMSTNSMHEIVVDSSEIAETGYKYVRLSTDETVDFAVVGSVLAIVIPGRYSPSPSLID